MSQLPLATALAFPAPVHAQPARRLPSAFSIFFDGSSDGSARLVEEGR